MSFLLFLSKTPDDILMSKPEQELLLLFSTGVDRIQSNFLSPPMTQMNFDFST